MKLKREVKVGVFAGVTILLITFATIRVGDQSVVAGGAYDLYAIFDNAAGLYSKAAVEIAGVNVGIVKKVGLTQDGKAQVLLGIQKNIHISEDSAAFLRSRGFLGESYVEIVPGDPNLPPLKGGAYLGKTEAGGDVTEMVDKFTSVADDVKEITRTFRKWMNEKEGGLVVNTVHHLNEFARVMRDVSVRNEKNMNQILVNMAELTHELRDLVHASHHDAEEAVDRIASITQKIDEGRGTIGRLVNDPETADKLNDSLDRLSDALGGYRKMELGMGFHTEYLGRSSDFKNYVSLSLKPTPDEAVLIDIVTDPSPDTSRETKTSTITTGGTSTTVTTDNETLKRDSILLSAQLAKKFYNLTVRGGVIQSKGGVGADYQVGPVGLHFDAFDFETDFNEKPHLKGTGSLHFTKNWYILGGIDDPLNPAQRTDYFAGAGFQMVDDDIKGLLNLTKFR